MKTCCVFALLRGCRALVFSQVTTVKGISQTTANNHRPTAWYVELGPTLLSLSPLLNLYLFNLSLHWLLEISLLQPQAQARLENLVSYNLHEINFFSPNTA